MPFKNALVSVSNKEGLIELLTPLVKAGLRVVSTGGTARHLRDHGLPVVDISEQTHFPEILDGRVKTLHPYVHMALLARLDSAEHRQVLKEYKIEPFDLVICNLYPFEASAQKGLTGEDLIEQIDIGGPSMLRSSAKNFNTVTVVCDPQDYPLIASGSNLELRQALAAKVFAHTSYYDSLISFSLSATQDAAPTFALGLKEKQSLRYGENPHQKAKWYVQPLQRGLQSAEILQGKELSYNNILDLDAALSLACQFSDPCAVAVKHNNPCGVATDKNAAYALEKALKADPVSVFGGIIAFNREVGLFEAQMLNQLFLECVLAPSFSTEALQELSKKKNLRLLQMAFPRLQDLKTQYKSVYGGWLAQEPDVFFGRTEHWNFLNNDIQSSIVNDMLFGERVCASLKSNAIAIVREGQTLGLGMGQVNRVDAVEQAVQRMKEHHGAAKMAVLVSDAFFPFADSIEKIAKAGIGYILQPGGSVKDQEVIEAANKYEIKMVLTGSRHFRH